MWNGVKQAGQSGAGKWEYSVGQWRGAERPERGNGEGLLGCGNCAANHGI